MILKNFGILLYQIFSIVIIMRDARTFSQNIKIALSPSHHAHLSGPPATAADLWSAFRYRICFSIFVDTIIIVTVTAICLYLYPQVVFPIGEWINTSLFLSILIGICFVAGVHQLVELTYHLIQLAYGFLYKNKMRKQEDMDVGKM